MLSSAARRRRFTPGHTKSILYESVDCKGIHFQKYIFIVRKIQLDQDLYDYVRNVVCERAVLSPKNLELFSVASNDVNFVLTELRHLP